MRRGLVVLQRHDDDEFGQIQRVLRVLARVDGGTLQKVERVHDHKGTLHVTWLAEPLDQDMIAVEREWAEEGEHELVYRLPEGQEFNVLTNETIRTPTTTQPE